MTGEYRLNYKRKPFDVGYASTVQTIVMDPPNRKPLDKFIHCTAVPYFAHELYWDIMRVFRLICFNNRQPLMLDKNCYDWFASAHGPT